MVDFGEDYTGKRIRLTYENDAAANKAIEDYEKEVKRRGEWWARLREVERQEVQLVYQKATAAGLTLSKVWDDHERWSKEHGAVTTPMTCKKVIEEWRRRKTTAGKSKDSRCGVRPDVNGAPAILHQQPDGRDPRVCQTARV